MKMTALALFVLLAACGPATPMDTVDSLVADPERLNEVRQQCRVDRLSVSEELCRRAAVATTQRFLGKGPTLHRQKTGRNSDRSSAITKLRVRERMRCDTLLVAPVCVGTPAQEFLLFEPSLFR